MVCGVCCVGRQSLIGTTNLKGVCAPGVIASSVSFFVIGSTGSPCGVVGRPVYYCVLCRELEECQERKRKTKKVNGMLSVRLEVEGRTASI
jgi:hypothetical protein